MEVVDGSHGYRLVGVKSTGGLYYRLVGHSSTAVTPVDWLARVDGSCDYRFVGDGL